MRKLFLACAFFGACTPVNVSDNRVMSDGKVNGATPQVSGSNDANPNPGTGPKPTPGDPNPALSTFLPVAYTEDLEPQVQKFCTGTCHTGEPAAGPNLLNSADALKEALGPAAAAIDAGRMPPNQATLSASDKKFLAQLSVSMKNWSKNEAYANALADFTITYTPAISAAATALCLNCHSGAQPAAGLRLDSLDQWKNNMPRILNAIESGRMPPRIDEVQGPRLVKFLTTWQNQGFP